LILMSIPNAPDHFFDEWQIELHGHRVIYRIAGEGPPVVLIHGMINSSRHWEKVALRLAKHHTVIAPDLLGHGDSATPRGDYSLGAHAASIRDLLVAIGVDKATIVGHSLGGGVAMQYLWQFPQRVERIVLVSSGGLGREVSPLLRTAALPGASAALALVGQSWLLGAIERTGGAVRRVHRPTGRAIRGVARSLRVFESPGARRAFLQTLRAVIDTHGQRVSATDRLYLSEGLPTMFVWGERDRTIPLAHGLATHEQVPHSRFETLPTAHFPHLEDPDGLARLLIDFIATTEPADIDDEQWRRLLVRKSPRARVAAS
jgi:pimeloyl-ACP methyl ester carboxylesterase